MRRPEVVIGRRLIDPVPVHGCARGRPGRASGGPGPANQASVTIAQSTSLLSARAAPARALARDRDHARPAPSRCEPAAPPSPPAQRPPAPRAGPRRGRRTCPRRRWSRSAAAPAPAPGCGPGPRAGWPDRRSASRRPGSRGIPGPPSSASWASTTASAGSSRNPQQRGGDVGPEPELVTQRLGPDRGRARTRSRARAAAATGRSRA